jgi:hypothetical protein
MPPVLDVALDELARRGAQQVLARERRPRVQQRHARPGADRGSRRRRRLVEGRARPDPAGERLVEQPAVEQQVHRPIGRLDLDDAEHVVPVSA